MTSCQYTTQVSRSVEISVSFVTTHIASLSLLLKSIERNQPEFGPQLRGHLSEMERNLTLVMPPCKISPNGCRGQYRVDLYHIPSAML
jgi:hypothetical protein